MHAPVLTRLRGAGREPRPFQQQEVRMWVWGSVLLLILAAVLPIIWPESLTWMQRLTPILSLFFFLAAGGHWMRMGNRAFAVAGALVVLVYALSFWTALLELEDFYVVAVLSSLLVFALAGFNLVFILEEVVYDAHRLTRLVHPAWRWVPTVFVLGLAVGLPFLDRAGGPRFPALWIASLVAAAIMFGWWFVRLVNRLEEGRVLKELHLLVVGGLAAAGLIDGARLLTSSPGFFPTLLAYLVLVGTWLYVSYTTLQRTQFLLRGGDAMPWLLILLGASFALLQHAYLHFRVEGQLGVEVLVNQRVAYIVAGIVVGIAFYVAQNVWRILRAIRDERAVGPRGRVLAGRFARLAEGLLHTERRLLEGTAYRVYQGVERVIPGQHTAPARPGWELDTESGTLRRMDEEE